MFKETTNNSFLSVFEPIINHFQQTSTIIIISLLILYLGEHDVLIGRHRQRSVTHPWWHSSVGVVGFVVVLLLFAHRWDGFGQGMHSRQCVRLLGTVLEGTSAGRVRIVALVFSVRNCFSFSPLPPLFYANTNIFQWDSAIIILA